MPDLKTCPICEHRHSLQHGNYINTKSKGVGERILCTECGNIWHSMDAFEIELALYHHRKHEARTICQVCTGEVSHRADSPWHHLDRAPHVCQTCQVCPSCGTRHFKGEEGKVTCLVCGERWNRAQTYENDIQRLVKALRLGDDPKAQMW